jgi:hypothetical protein
MVLAATNPHYYRSGRRTALALGGTPSGEHGTDIATAPLLTYEVARVELSITRIKKVLSEILESFLFRLTESKCKRSSAEVKFLVFR